MNHLRKLIALTALALLPAALATANDSTTHLNVKSNRVVNLVWSFDATAVCPDNNQGPRSFFRLKATGEPESDPFVVPNGNRLIITDVAWVASPNPNSSFAAGRLLRIYLTAQRADAGFGDTIYTATGIPVTSTTSQWLSGSDRYSSGIAVAPGRILCATANAVSSGGSLTHYPREVRISGYLSKI